MSYELEIKEAYSRLRAIATDLVADSADFRIDNAYQFVKTHSPMDTQTVGRDSLLEELTKPEKELYRKAYDALRHKTPFDTNISNSTIETPSIRWLNNELNRTVQGRDSRPIIFRGAKGIGKTTSLNFVINSRNQEFHRDKVFLVRGNAEEYFAIKRDFFADRPHAWDVREYMKYHTVNLCVAHKDKEPFRSIVNDVSNQTLDSSIDVDWLPKPIKRLMNDGPVRVSHLIDYIAAEHATRKHFAGVEDRLTYDLIKKVIQRHVLGSTLVFQNAWPALWSSFEPYLVSKNIKVFFIMDALDNVWSFNSAEKQAYQSTISDLAAELNNYRQQGSSTTRFFYIVACRPETFRELITASHKRTAEECNWRFNQAPDQSDAEKIVTTKLLHFMKSDKFREDVGGTAAKTKFSETLQSADYFGHIQRLSHAIKRNPEDVFSGNTRAIIHNFLSFCIYLSYHSREVLAGELPAERTQFHLFVRNLFFGGRRFIRTSDWNQSNQWKHSIIFPNLFHYDASSQLPSTIRNPLLCGFRMLDFIETSGVCTDDEVLEEMLSASYDKNLVTNFLHLFMQFRLVEPVEPEVGAVRPKAGLRCLPSVAVLRYICRESTDVIAYLAFDSIMQKGVYDWVFEGIDLKLQNRRYITNTIAVGLKFIAYLNATSSKEGREAEYFPIDGFIERTDYLLSELALLQKNVDAPRQFLDDLSR